MIYYFMVFIKLKHQTKPYAIGDQENEKEHSIPYGSHKNTHFIRN